MVSRKYVTVHQYEPLQVPSRWGEEEQRLVNRLTEIFDDIYRRYGRLGVEDVSKAFADALDTIRRNVSAADGKAEEAQRKAEESFAAANNAARQACLAGGRADSAYALAKHAGENRYEVGDCLTTAVDGNPSERYGGGWELIGSGALPAEETVWLWKRVD